MARKRILIIDDEADIREIAQMSLEAVPDWEISTAFSGKEGLQKALMEQPDAVLLDVMMPEMDGPATFKKFQETIEVSHIPVVMLTAKVQTSDRRRFLAMGVKGVLPKPFDPVSLPADLAEILGWEA
ncbi:MAG TPA: response regulator [Terriglobia bacterium]|nr:response regulator [Terriglobia bacterium]